MPLDPRTQAWFAELNQRAAHLPPEQRAAIQSLQNLADTDKTIGDTLLRSVTSTAENTRRAQEIQRQQQEIAAQKAEVDGYRRQLESWNAANNGKLEEVQSRFQQAVTKLAELRGKALASGNLSEGDFNFDDILKGQPTTPQPTPQPSPQQPAQQPAAAPFLTRDEAAEFGRTTIFGVAQLMELGETHKELFGQRLDINALIATATQQNRPLQQVYDELYNPSAKRAELQTLQINKQIEERAAALVEAKLKEVFATQSGNPLNPNAITNTPFGDSALFSEDFRKAATPTADAPVKAWSAQEDARLAEEAARDFTSGLAGLRG